MSEVSRSELAGIGAAAPNAQVIPFRYPVNNGYVITAIKDATTADYLKAIVDVIGKSKVKAFGRIGPNFAFWVNDEKSLPLLEVTESVSIKGQTAFLWPYVKPIRKVKLIGVPPFLPDEKLKEALSSYGTIKGEIKTEMLFGLPEEFGEIESFNRSLDIACERDVVLPEKLTILNGKNSFEIMVQVGRRKCFRCGLAGHVSSGCKADRKLKGNWPPLKIPEKPAKVVDYSSDASIVMVPAEYGYQTDGVTTTDIESDVPSENTETKSPSQKNRKKLRTATKRKQNEVVSTYSLRNKDPEKPQDWHINEWKHHTFSDPVLNKNELLELLNGILLNPNKSIANHQKLIEKYEVEPEKLGNQLHELKQILHGKNKTSRELVGKLAKLCNPNLLP